MKNKKIRMLVYVLIFFGIFSSASVIAYKTGFIEDKLSSMIIPFNWFYNYKLANVSKYEISDNGTYDIKEYESLFNNFSEEFSLENKDRPNIGKLTIDKESKIILENFLNETYGVENTYIANFNISGISQTRDGWGVILTAAVVNDTNIINNVSFSTTYKDGKLCNLKKINDEEKDYWYDSIPDNANVSIISEAKKNVEKYIDNNLFEGDSVSIQDDERKLLRNNNYRLSGVYYYYSEQKVILEYVFGTENGKIKKVIFNINSENNSIDSIN